MSQNRKNNRFTAILALAVLAAAALALVRLNTVRREDLIMTDSSHEKVQFLKLENQDLTETYRVFFCLYDEECDSVQVCIRVPKNDDTLWEQPGTISFFADGEETEGYRYMNGGTKWNRKYLMFFLDEVKEFETVRVEYEGAACTASMGE